MDYRVWFDNGTWTYVDDVDGVDEAERVALERAAEYGMDGLIVDSVEPAELAAGDMC